MPSEWDVVAEQPVGGAGGWDVVGEAPAAPVADGSMSFQNPAARGAARVIGANLKRLGMAAAVPVWAGDKLEEFVTGRDPLVRDKMFDVFAAPADRLIQQNQRRQNESFTDQLQGGAGEFVGMLPDLAAGMAAKAPQAVQQTFQAVPNIVREAITGAGRMFPAAATSADAQYKQLVEQGVDPARAAAAATVQGTGLMAMGAAPATMPGKFLTQRLPSAVGFNVASGAAMRQAQNAILPPEMRQDVFDPASMTLDTLLAVPFAAAGPRTAGPEIRPQFAPVYDRFDGRRLETPEEATARIEPVEPPQPVSRNPEQAVQQVMDRLFRPADPEAAPAAPEDFVLTPKAADRTAPRSRRDVEQAVQDVTYGGDIGTQYRAPELPTEGEPRAATPDIADAVAERIRTEQAFREAELRKQRAESDRIRAEQQGADPTEFRTQPDYAFGDANTRRPATATLLMLDAKRGRDERLAGGVPIEPVGPEMVQTAKGPVPGLRVRLPDGTERAVPMERLSPFEQPVNPRMAQDTAASTRNASPRAAVQERADAGIPNRLRDSVGTSSREPYNPIDTERTAAPGEVLPPDTGTGVVPREPAQRAPIQGEQRGDIVPRQQGAVVPANPPDAANRVPATEPATAAPRALPAPEQPRPQSTPEQRRAEFETQKREREQRRKSLREAFAANGERLSGTSTRDPNRRLILTPSTRPDVPYQVTSLDENGPSGHRDYTSLDEALGEFMPSDIAIDKPEAPRADTPAVEPWDEPQAPPKQGDVSRAREDGMAEPLREMASTAGWSEKAGTLLREGGKVGEGTVIGRTKEWVAKAAWFKAMRDALPGKVGLSNPAEIKAAVEKAIRGDKLNRREAATVNFMLDEIEGFGRTWQDEAGIDPFAMDMDLRAEGVRAETPEDAAFAALTARAALKDADAVERAAIEFENDPDAFARRMQEIVDGPEIQRGEGSPRSSEVRPEAGGEPRDPAGSGRRADAGGVSEAGADGERPAADASRADSADAGGVEPTAEALRGRSIEVDVEVGDSGRTAKMTVDAGKALEAIEARLDALRKLAGCVK